MPTFSKPIYAVAGYNTVFFGPGRREFDPRKPMPQFETYLQEAADGVCGQLPNPAFDEGIVTNFVAARFLKQNNLAGFLPYVVPDLVGKPCTGVEGACGSGGLGIAAAAKAVLSGLAETVFVLGFEIQNTVKPVYGADVLAAAGYYHGQRKQGHAFFFPGLFSDRAGVYYQKYGYEEARRAMAKWYENAIVNARKNPKAQEYHNATEDLLALGMTPPNGKTFLDHLNPYDCSKVSDGASAVAIASAEGLRKLGVEREEAVEIVGLGQAEGDITQAPADPTVLETTAAATAGAMEMAGVKLSEVGVLELHDCFSISGLLALEAIGFAQPGRAPAFVLDGQLAADGAVATNASGGLVGFGHPTGASGVRMMVDLVDQFTGKAPNPAKREKPYGMMVSMGGDDKTVSAFVVKPCA